MVMLFKIAATIGSAMFAGVMLAIGIILGSYWKTLSPDEFLVWFSDNNQFIMRAIPFVVLPTLVGLAGCIRYSWNDPPTLRLWLIASGGIVVVFLITMIFFVPLNALFAAKKVELIQVSPRLNLWLFLHSVRIGITIASSAIAAYASTRGN